MSHFMGWEIVDRGRYWQALRFGVSLRGNSRAQLEAMIRHRADDDDRDRRKREEDSEPFQASVTFGTYEPAPSHTLDPTPEPTHTPDVSGGGGDFGGGGASGEF